MRAVGIRVGVDQRFAQIGDGREEPEHGITAYADLEDALPHVDAVIIATPPTSHASLAMKAIAAGKHVLIEKPMATTTDAAGGCPPWAKTVVKHGGRMEWGGGARGNCIAG
jgi:Oxidoreductase family, NAD-binding Rossmann fold